MRCHLVVAIVVALAVPTVATAQTLNDARLLSTLSPAALDQPVGLSIGISSLGPSLGGALAVGDISIGPGALRLVAARPSHFASYGVGYALRLASQPLGPALSATLGGELSLGYLGMHLPKNDYIIGNGTSVNAHLAMPLSVHLGAAGHLSLTPYIAPYAEVGAAPSGYWTPLACNMYTPCARFTYSDHYRTSALGAALGARLTIWRIGVDAAAGDVSRVREQRLSAAVALRV